MLNRDPEREHPRPLGQRRWRAVAEPSLQSDGLAAFRRAYRWLNLTLIHHGIWPLLVVVFGAPAVPLGLTPLPWYWARLGVPVLATLLAFAYLAQRPEGLPGDAALRESASRSERDRRWREQATILLIGSAVAVAILRLVQGPALPVMKMEAFGLADVAAFQVINFGLVGRAAAPDLGQALPVALFGLSWGLRDLFLAAASPAGESLALTFAGGAMIGLFFGATSWGLRRWPGGYLAASAFQFLVVYLALGFVA